MEVQTVTSLREVSPNAWNVLRSDDFPFSRYEHLLALESTQCLGDRTGWAPVYLLAFETQKEAASGRTPRNPIYQNLSGATWFYEKTNSYGEFVFDAEWADLHERLGVNYYPKTVSAIPFTPATGNKVLAKGPLQETISSLLIETAKKLSKRFGMSSYHHLFIPGEKKKLWADSAFHLRRGVQFHWRNNHYTNFDEFLQALKKKRRKEINYERRGIDSDIAIKELSGSDLTAQWADFAYLLYQKTNVEKMSFVCLTREYFQEIFDKLKNYIKFFVALNKGTGRPIAGALFFVEGESMFGRYWGCLEERKFLHFEICYYAPIETAIHEKIQLIEAGAQGPHKISRGFLPTYTYSAHQFFHSQIHDAFAKFCSHEERLILEGISNYSEHFPYKELGEIKDAGRGHSC